MFLLYASLVQVPNVPVLIPFVPKAILVLGSRGRVVGDEDFTVLTLYDEEISDFDNKREEFTYPVLLLRYPILRHS